jgi:hypothetical protein
MYVAAGVLLLVGSPVLLLAWSLRHVRAHILQEVGR